MLVNNNSKSKLILIIAILISNFGCTREKEQIEKFIYDNSQLNTRQIHHYEFDREGKIKTDNSIIYTYIAGLPADSIISREEYSFNKNGKICSIFDTANNTKQLNLYNDKDSLIARYRINDGDTTFLEQFNYINNKKHSIITRYLELKMPEDLNDFKEKDFDTLYSKKDFIYKNGQIFMSIEKNKSGKTLKETEYIYKDKKLKKEITYAFLDNLKYLFETNYYALNNQSKYDFVKVDKKGDTIFSRRTFLQEDGKAISEFMKNLNSQNIYYYNKKGQMIGNVTLNFIERTKISYTYSYDKKGNLIEELTYREALTKQ